MHFLTESLWFPDPENATREGLLAIGGDLSTERLLLAYRSGIFPWYEEGEPRLWWSPDPRMVLFPKQFKVSKSLQKIIDKGQFSVTYNSEFRKVIALCAKVKRKGQRGTWITPEMIAMYYELHKMGYAQSVEVWQNGTLVGGLYGVDLKEQKIFCGESMFSEESNASKVGLSAFISKLIKEKYKLIDCQIYSEHLERLGAVEISRTDFLKYLSA
jgi:leucyl/phenylalanyl-tRNA--protein transferase